MALEKAIADLCLGFDFILNGQQILLPPLSSYPFSLCWWSNDPLVCRKVQFPFSSKRPSQCDQKSNSSWAAPTPWIVYEITDSKIF